LGAAIQIDTLSFFKAGPNKLEDQGKII